jgi:hypothetical protein
MVVLGAKEPIMTAMVQTEKVEVSELSLEEMEQVGGGEENGVEYFAAYIAWRCKTIYKGPLR